MVQPAAHEDEATEVRAVAVLLPPLVMKEGDQLTGFGIDLWREVAARLKVKRATSWSQM